MKCVLAAACEDEEKGQEEKAHFSRLYTHNTPHIQACRWKKTWTRENIKQILYPCFHLLFLPKKIAGASLLLLEEKVGCELCVSIYIYISSSYSRIEKRLDVMHLLLLFLTAFFLLSFGNVKKFSPHNKIRRKSFFLEDLKYLYACLYMFLYIWIICKLDELYTLYNRMKAWRVLTLRIRINRSSSGGGVCIVIILF